MCVCYVCLLCMYAFMYICYVRMLRMYVCLLLCIFVQLLKQIEFRCPAAERITCEGNMQPLSPGKDACGCDKPEECVFITSESASAALVPSLLSVALLSFARRAFL